jgi:arylsulfatase
VSADAELTERPDEIPAWDDMPDDLKPVLARQMEVYAGCLEPTDHHVGRLIDALDDLGLLENTLVYYVVGDNGASAEGTPTGCFNEFVVNGAAGVETVEFMTSRCGRALRGRRGRRPRACAGDGSDALLCRRDDRRRERHGDAGER